MSLHQTVRLFLVLFFVLCQSGCSDEKGLLPLSEYENIDVNVYFYTPDNIEKYLGKTRGARSCGDMSYSHAKRINLTRNDNWSYICCTVRNGSSCYEKIR
jgi:hypothetical protein